MVTSLRRLYAVDLGVSGFPFDLNKKKMFLHINFSPLLPSCLTMKMHIEFYGHNRKDNAHPAIVKGKEEKYITCPNEQMNHRN